MAYGKLAGVTPVAGLWAILPPILVYSIWGSSRHLSLGPESTSAVMTAVSVAPLVRGGQDYGSMAALLALAVGIVCLVAYTARLGFLANLLSKPILIGYMAGVAVIMIAGQLGKISGFSSNEETVIGQFREFFLNLYIIDIPTFLLSLLVLGFLFTLPRFFPQAPGPLLAVLLATLATAELQLDRQGVAVVGAIPAGLPYFSLPQVNSVDFLALFAAAVGVAIVGYSDTVLTARAFANRHGYRVDANQELLALGLANLANGFFLGFPISSSGSRTALGDAMRNKSQMFSLVAFLVVVLVLLFLRPLLALFPKAALGAIVIFAATKLVDFGEFRRLQQFRGSELTLALITILGVLTTGILTGVGIAVGLSVSESFARITRPHDAILGTVPDITGLHDIKDWSGAATIPGLVIYRYDAPLFFANAEDFQQRVFKVLAAQTSPVEWLILNTESIIEFDITAVDMLAQLQAELSKRGITFGLARVKHDLYQQLEHSGLLAQIGREHIYFTLPTAIAAFKISNNTGDKNP
jgi:high affinity sulfate transporter 1